MPSLPVGKLILFALVISTGLNFFFAILYMPFFSSLNCLFALYNLSLLYCSKCHLVGAREFSVIR